ncbi:DUF1254 domain-containing protein [Scandinavium goeteborgense]|uniref:DUF1254 domain-containing protein n=1 Tax=Scandinavium goeteborgense TaxID=1851514 RepID=UPI000F68D051|nr:DUF1214 domain-containing protein [Scandinavium goeteborgense]QKN81107.1 DUF1254 domain-containing protein [Scandinavium goeteborgense]
MKKNTLLLTSAIALALTGFSGAYASDAQTATAPVAANAQPAIPAGTVMTKEAATVIAKDAYVWGWPLVNAYNRRASFAHAPEPGLNGGILPVAPIGYVSMLHGYISPMQRWVAHPNQDVVYGFGYGAVDDDPVVLQVPDFGDRFWVYALYDARSDEFSKIGKQYGTKPGNYLVVGPNWKGKVPAGITKVIHSPTELVAMGPRVFVNDDQADQNALQSVLNQVVIYPLSKYDGKKKTTDWKNSPHFPADSSGATEIKWVEPTTFFDQLADVMTKVPPLPGEEARYAAINGMLAAAKADPEIKKAIDAAAAETEEQVVKPMFDFKTNGQALPNGWNTPANGARWGYDYITRTATAKSNMYVNQPEETRYFFVEVDGKGERLNGDNNYTITFAKGQTPPVNGFWSLTMYDPQHFFAKNDTERYSVGTKNLKNMTYNADGSLTIYVQHDSPGKEKETNWLPAPKSDFEMTIRTYWPKAEVLNKTWTPPVVEQAAK